MTISFIFVGGSLFEIKYVSKQCENKQKKKYFKWMHSS